MTIHFPALRFAIPCAAALIFAGCGGGGGGSSSTATPATPAPTSGGGPGVLSISASPQAVPAPTTAAQAASANTAALNMVYGAGARGQVATYTWSALETAPGQYNAANFADLSSNLQRAQTLSLTQYVGIQLINTTVNELPADLAGSDFAAPAVLTRFHALLDQVVGAHRGQISYLSIGNEVDAYLAANPGKVAGYKTFFLDAAQYARTLDPAIRVGVTGTGDGALGTNAALLQSLNAGSDVVMLTYYPLQTDASGTVTVRDPSVVAGDFVKMLAFAGSKPLVLQEVGYPASAGNLSSEALQAAFIRQVFAAWLAAGGRIPFLNIFLLHDFTPQTCSSLLTYYHLPPNASYTDYLCSLGMLQDDGTIRQAWPVLLDAAAQAHLP